MRELVKRLDRLETAGSNTLEPIRIIHQIIGAENGRPTPWRPNWARCGDERLTRHDSESSDAFEARALAHFADERARIVIGG